MSSGGASEARDQLCGGAGGAPPAALAPPPDELSLVVGQFVNLSSCTPRYTGFFAWLAQHTLADWVDKHNAPRWDAR